MAATAATNARYASRRQPATLGCRLHPADRELNKIPAELGAGGTAELLTGLDSGHRKAWSAVRQMYGTPGYRSQWEMSGELYKLSADAYWATFESGIRLPGEYQRNSLSGLPGKPRQTCLVTDPVWAG